MIGWLTHAPPSPILLHLGVFTLRWYGVIMAVALLAGVLLAQRLGKRAGISPDHVLDLALLATVLAVVGARVLHVFNEWSYYAVHLGEIVKFWHGGLAFHGVLFGGLLALWLFSRWRRIAPLALLDVSLPALTLGQVIGRWGNWFNQELYGRPTTLPWGFPIDLAHRLTGYENVGIYHPLFLYESLGNLVVLAILLLLWHRSRRAGVVAGTYLVLSPALRFGLDFFRLRQPMIGNFTNAQVFSLVLIAAGVALLLFTYRQKSVQ